MAARATTAVDPTSLTVVGAEDDHLRPRAPEALAVPAEVQVDRARGRHPLDVPVGREAARVEDDEARLEAVALLLGELDELPPQGLEGGPLSGGTNDQGSLVRWPSAAAPTTRVRVRGGAPCSS